MNTGSPNRTSGVKLPISSHEPTLHISNKGRTLLLNPEYLLEGSIEKHCYLLGVLQSVPMHQNLSSRSETLKLLDKKRTNGELPWKVGAKERVTLWISAYGIKITRNDENFSILHRFGLHEIASVSYVHDDRENLLLLKVGGESRTHCQLFVFACTKKKQAEDICNVIDQAFEIVYTEIT
ncbi:PREDICTED: cerebral cavernous malformations protein 2 homolog, partial [Amphimedon queenslandica]|uniref:PID domain-containing protein n=2 Tax=Amphimedon queenslandica TaxID=400682 RepID=A0AAN0ITG7_AMPQE